jgi:WD40 repeat protein
LNGVESVAFSPDGKRIASGSYDNTIFVWDAETGEIVLGPLKGHTSTVISVAFSSDGKQIVSGSRDNMIRVWDIEAGQVHLGPLKGHASMVESIAFSPDGNRIASGSFDNTIRVWDAETGEVVLGPLKGHNSEVISVAFSPDGKQIVSGSQDKTIRVWDIGTSHIVTQPLYERLGGTGNIHDNVEPCFGDSSIMVDGWVLGSNWELLFWVPPSMHDGLWRPRNVAIIAKAIQTKLDFKLFCHGNSWTLCKR